MFVGTYTHDQRNATSVWALAADIGLVMNKTLTYPKSSNLCEKVGCLIVCVGLIVIKCQGFENWNWKIKSHIFHQNSALISYVPWLITHIIKRIDFDQQRYTIVWRSKWSEITHNTKTRAWCLVCDTIVITAQRCRFDELLPLFTEFCDILFSNFNFQHHAVS